MFDPMHDPTGRCGQRLRYHRAVPSDSERPTNVVVDDASKTTPDVDPASADTAVASTRGTMPAPPRDQHDVLQPGARLGDRYVVHGFLGAGGMGAVYRVYDEVLGQDVALKALRGSQLASESLRDEVRVAQQVTHDSVCRIYDLEDIGGRHFVKMEYVAGETLANRIDRGPLPIELAIRIARGVAAGLAAAHARGIVHRDLKPGNVMLAGQRVVLMDFGLAMPIRDEPSDPAGTPGYMSPEQMAGRRLDERSDLYALGCLLYEMLAGERAFVASSFTAMARAQSRPLPDVHAKRPDAPRWLVRATTLLGSLDPDERPRGAKLLARGRGRAWLALPLVAIAVPIVAALAWPRPKAPTWTPHVTPLPVYKEHADQAFFTSDDRSIVYTATRQDNIYRVYLGPITGEPRLLFDGIQVGDVSAAADGTILYSTPADHLFRARPDGSESEDLGIAMQATSCGHDIVASSTAGDIFLIRPDGQREAVAPAGMQSTPRCNPTGNLVAFTRFAPPRKVDVFLYDRRSRAERQLTHDGSSLDPVFTGPSSLVISNTGGDDTKLIELMLDDGESHVIAHVPHTTMVSDVSHDGRSLLLTTVPRAPELVQTRSDGTSHQVLDRVVELSNAFYASDTTIIATRTSGDGPVVVAIDTATDRMRDIAPGFALFASRDGKRVFLATPTSGSELRAVPIEGGASVAIATLPQIIARGVEATDGLHVGLVSQGDVGWRITGGVAEREADEGAISPAPSGGWRVLAIVRDAGVTLRVVPPGAPLERGHELRSSGFHLTWLDDHRFAYFVDQSVHVYDVADGSDREAFKATNAGPAARLSPDGTRWIDFGESPYTERSIIDNFADRPWR
jgi:hypothetical protein